MKDFTFHIPTKITFGEGRFQELNSVIEISKKNILLVTDFTILSETNIIKDAISILKNRNVYLFKEVEENPSYSTVENGFEFAKANRIDQIIGIGGGSSMDAAKGIALRMSNEESIKNIVEQNLPINNAMPIICIPTSSGTGSETTPFAVFTDTETHLKHGYSHPSIFPYISLIDPRLSYSMPKSVVINTGLDALSHAMEAYLSNLSFEVNDQIALEAIKIIIKNLEKASKKNPKAMNEMAYAAMLGGVVISHASTILPHIMGYPLTSNHNLAHGKACIILLPAFIRYLKKYNLKADKTKILDRFFIAKGGLENFIESLGVSLNLSDYGVDISETSDYSKQTILKGDVQITPGNISEKTIASIYKDCFTIIK